MVLGYSVSAYLPLIVARGAAKMGSPFNTFRFGVKAAINMQGPELLASSSLYCGVG